MDPDGNQLLEVGWEIALFGIGFDRNSIRIGYGQYQLISIRLRNHSAIQCNFNASLICLHSIATCDFMAVRGGGGGGGGGGRGERGRVGGRMCFVMC